MSNLTTRLDAALNELTKCVLSQPIDKGGVSKVTIRPIASKAGRAYQLERFDSNRAYHQNLAENELLDVFTREYDGRFRQALIVTETSSEQYTLKTNGNYKKTAASAVVSRPAALSHDREKEYILKEGENIPALVDLGVFTTDFKIVRAKYDKYKQINRFIELVDDEFSAFERDEITILDFGCGKSYLTFILYYYFTVRKGLRANIIGYDLKEDVVENCNRIAKKYSYDNLEFVVADVTRDKLSDRDIDMIVTLHACDIATDYALDYAIKKGVKYIFSVPCCQHEVNSQIKKGGELDIFLRHGIIKERMSALLTDSIRASVLEDMGYAVDMIEFIDFAHSPKNIMIRAKKTGKTGRKNIDAARALCERYGVKQTLLELCTPEISKKT